MGEGKGDEEEDGESEDENEDDRGAELLPNGQEQNGENSAASTSDLRTGKHSAVLCVISRLDWTMETCAENLPCHQRIPVSN